MVNLTLHTHNHTHTPKGLPHQLGRVLNVIVRQTSGDKFLEVYNKESQQAKEKKIVMCGVNSLSVCM